MITDEEREAALKDPNLTQREKDDIEKLTVGFHITRENNNHIIIASKRVEISRKWAGKLLFSSLVLNVFSMICFLIAAFFVIKAPEPNFYGTTPDGKIYPLISGGTVDEIAYLSGFDPNVPVEEKKDEVKKESSVESVESVLKNLDSKKQESKE